MGSVHITFETIQKVFHLPRNEGVEVIQPSVLRVRKKISHGMRERTTKGTCQGHSVEID